jgi:hypothetical protein
LIKLPDFKKSFEYENNFYLSCDITRMSKILAHYELFKLSQNIPGEIIECGVFKGASLARFAAFRDIFENQFSKKIIAFDIFGKFPNTKFSKDKDFREKFIEAAGSESISKKQLMEVLKHKGTDKNVELIQGDITKTVPKYLEKHPELKISILNLDTDIYEPAVTILENFYKHISKGGILILDDYATFPGETKAVDDFFKNKKIKIQKFSFSKTPCYLIKD